jgi:hypothetical protein
MPETPAEKAPTSTLDPYTDQSLLNPCQLYRELREIGPHAVLRATYAGPVCRRRSRAISARVATEKKTPPFTSAMPHNV